MLCCWSTTALTKYLFFFLFTLCSTYGFVLFVSVSCAGKAPQHISSFLSFKHADKDVIIIPQNQQDQGSPVNNNYYARCSDLWGLKLTFIYIWLHAISLAYWIHPLNTSKTELNILNNNLTLIAKSVLVVPLNRRYCISHMYRMEWTFGTKML